MSKELLTQIIQKAVRQQINPLIFEEVRIEQSALSDLLKEAFQVLGFTVTDISSDIQGGSLAKPPSFDDLFRGIRVSAVRL